jgi:hypothetical protein
MEAKLQTEEGKEIYRQRKKIAEPVFGQIKFNLGFRMFRLSHQLDYYNKRRPNQAIDWMPPHLKKGHKLPPSQRLNGFPSRGSHLS